MTSDVWLEVNMSVGVIYRTLMDFHQSGIVAVDQRASGFRCRDDLSVKPLQMIGVASLNSFHR